jgi:hypothetical protein
MAYRSGCSLAVGERKLLFEIGSVPTTPRPVLLTRGEPLIQLVRPEYV